MHVLNLENDRSNLIIIQHLYQISPSNDALKVLLKSGFNSAYDVVAFSKEDFLNKYSVAFSSKEEAQIIYKNAQHVVNTIKK
jgi:hypothetical protein